MKRKYFLVGLFLILVIFLVGCVPPVNVKVSGTVYYSTTPVPDVMVELVSGDATDPPVFSTKTNIFGTFTFFDVPSGNYWLKAYVPPEEYIGWQARSITVGSIDLISDIYLKKKLHQ